MATLDDKLLGEKTHNYCSSSEDEREEEDDVEVVEEKNAARGERREMLGAGKAKWEGYSQNTGPKGVLRDWQLFKEHEERVRLERERSLAQEVKSKCITVQSFGEEERDKEIDELLGDEVLAQFVKKRMESVAKGVGRGGVPIHSGVLHSIRDADEFLGIVEGSDGKVPVVIHIYEAGNRVCGRMNECLNGLAPGHPGVQFCNVLASCVGVSGLFRSKGVPALLVYKGGNLVGNFVQLGEEFGDEFCEQDVENFLVENGMILGGSV